MHIDRSEVAMHSDTHPNIPQIDWLAVEGGGVPEQVVITEVQFFGRQIQLGLTGIDREACSYGYIYNRDTGDCEFLS